VIEKGQLLIKEAEEEIMKKYKNQRQKMKK